MPMLMRTVTLEEHFNVPELVARIPKEKIRERGFPGPGEGAEHMARPQAKLKEVGAARLADMDAGEVTVQVLSVAGPGADLLPAKEGVAFAQELNDTLARIVAGHPTRYAGFAHLPMTDPAAAAEELQRCVQQHRFVGTMINGLTDGLFLDDPRFDPILAAAEQLDVPIYIHPNLPPAPVREAYYSNLRPSMGFLLSMAGWGWHSETAIHVLRLALSGALDRHPKLKLIIGHMGEGLPMMMARSDNVFHSETEKYLQRPLAQTLREQVYVTTSGQFTMPPLNALLATFGIDHVMYSIDYPFSPTTKGKEFLQSLPLSPTEIEQIAHGNADRLLKLRV